jgi:tagaturonate reductase
MPLPIMQFGTSRFLQAHVDLFVGEALSRGDAVGKIVVVQTTNSPESSRRVQALNTRQSYPVLIRGLDRGQSIERRVDVESIGRALQAQRDWAEIERLFVEDVRYVVSNTGDRGYLLDPDDRFGHEAPRSFPAKIAQLLYRRWERAGTGVTFLPCELTSRNGDVLRDIVIQIAQDWGLETVFVTWLRGECMWVNSLVDRIVSEALDPIGAVAEPYALWAIRDQPGLQFPCKHPDIKIVADLRPYEWLKLYILNLGHTFLADRWLKQRRPGGETVREALQDSELLSDLLTVYEQEVLPVFAAIGMGNEATAYKDTVLDRFANPFLYHRLSDIASNHDEKKQRRIGGLLQLASDNNLNLPTPQLMECLKSCPQRV